MKKQDKIIIKKINTYCSEIIDFSEDITFEEFSTDKRKNYMLVFPIGQIGELSNKLSNEFKEQYSEAPWRAAISVRNRLVHDYDGVSMDRIWQIIKIGIPDLYKYTNKILKDIKGEIL